MKDFVKWLGVNEKVAKIAVWMLIFMIFLIIINTALESLGLPFYKVTVENLSRIEINNIISYICNFLISLLNFYSIIFLVFPLNKFKKVLPYSMFYILFVIIISYFDLYVISQICIPLSILIFCFYLSNKNKKYVLYGIISLLINSTVQYVCYYLFKGKYVTAINISQINYIISSIDYLIAMFFIIISKEIYLKYKKKED